MIELKDNEIRFIGDEKSYDGTIPNHTPPEEMRQEQRFSPPPPDYHSSGGIGWSRILRLLLLIIVLIAAFLTYRLCVAEPDEGTLSSIVLSEEPSLTIPEDIIEGQFEPVAQTTDASLIDQALLLDADASQQAACVVREIEVNGIPFRVLLPMGAVPELHIGPLNQRDTTIILALQAADIRKDNGQIVGACVHHGNPVSKGLAKKGFVAIIDGRITIGVSDSSPYYERAVQSDGDFFRQYPLVDQGQIVENNPKNLSIRRGICQRQDETFVIESLVPISFHDFSQALVDMQVRDAVYLVGSQYACGLMRDASRKLTTWGEHRYANRKNISYLVWRNKP